jgi:hypothetical protein
VDLVPTSLDLSMMNGELWRPTPQFWVFCRKPCRESSLRRLWDETCLGGPRDSHTNPMFWLLSSPSSVANCTCRRIRTRSMRCNVCNQNHHRGNSVTLENGCRQNHLFLLDYGLWKRIPLTVPFCS